MEVYERPEYRVHGGERDSRIEKIVSRYIGVVLVRPRRVHLEDDFGAHHIMAIEPPAIAGQMFRLVDCASHSWRHI